MQDNFLRYICSRNMTNISLQYQSPAFVLVAFSPLLQKESRAVLTSIQRLFIHKLVNLHIMFSKVLDDELRIIHYVTQFEAIIFAMWV